MNPPERSPDPAAGRAAFDRRDWAEAHEILTRAEAEDGLEPDDLQRLAIAAYLIGRDEGYTAALERAHRGYREAGDLPPAARCAIWLGMHLAEHGDMAQASGWFGRARRLLEEHGEPCVEEAYLLLPLALRHFGAGEHESAARLASDASEKAREFGDRDLFALAVHLRGRALLRQGQVEDGLALLDEAMVAVSADELSPQVTGIVYCSVISACRRVFALDRAGEWTAALTEWCEAQPDIVAFRGQCRVFRSELMRLRGAWREAMDEASRVGAGGAGEDAVAGAAHYQQGEVHRLRGELGAAEESYRKASRAGREPQPGLALLRLAQGDADAANAAIRRALGEADDPFRRARLLPAHTEILLELGKAEEAERACRELESIAEQYHTAALDAIADQARGTVALDGDDPEGALGPLRRAWKEWRALDAPHDAARVRALIGRACMALGDEDSAAMELDAARAAFQALGATPDVDRLDARTSRRADRTHGLTPRELEVLALVATGKTNREVADELFISDKTVARHVSNIFGKLGVSSRSAATAYAYEHGLTNPPG